TAIVVLNVQQVGNPASQRLRAEIPARHQPNYRPGGLRSGAYAHALLVHILVGADGFAPSAVGILHHAQPLDCLLHHGIVTVEANGFQSAQHAHGAVNVVDAPASEPGTVGLLL